MTDIRRASRFTLILVLGAGVSTAQAPASSTRPETSSRPRGAARKPVEEGYVRFSGRRDDSRLETAWSVATHEDGREVWLVGVVHVGDKPYFEAMNGLLGAADLVLYEGVGGAATADMTMIARLQLAVGSLLDLGFQKDGVRYGRPHFVRADLDIEEIERRLAEKGERLLPGGDALKAFGPLLTRVLEGAAKAAERARAAGEPDAFGPLKASVAKILGDPQATQSATSRAWDEVVIGARNDAALEVMARETKNPVGAVALFYGAAHLPDFERKLAALGFRTGPKLWVTAWKIGKNAPAPAVVLPESKRRVL